MLQDSASKDNAPASVLENNLSVGRGGALALVTPLSVSSAYSLQGLTLSPLYLSSMWAP